MASMSSRRVPTIPIDKLYDLAGVSPRPIRGLKKDEYVVAWGKDPSLYVAARKGNAVNLFRVDSLTGQRQFWRKLVPPTRPEFALLQTSAFALDAQAYGYSYYRYLSQCI
jgi:hypothetical protein